MLFNVEILPLIVGTVFNISLGMLWYSGALFMRDRFKVRVNLQNGVK